MRGIPGTITEYDGPPEGVPEMLDTDALLAVARFARRYAAERRTTPDNDVLFTFASQVVAYCEDVLTFEAEANCPGGCPVPTSGRREDDGAILAEFSDDLSYSDDADYLELAPDVSDRPEPARPSYSPAITPGGIDS